MRRTAFALAFASTLGATALSAQQGPPPPGGGRGPASPLGNTAAFLLANTGALKLTDAQVVRLAAIARRADDRGRALRATMDSARTARGRMPRDSAARGQRGPVRDLATQTAFERMGEQMRTDRRDAIAVLTPDQQAQAWEIVAMRGAGPAFARRGMASGFGPRRDARPGRDGRDGGPRRDGRDGPPVRRPPG
jgi:Spy/CpxP family protein refolding chaperone